MNKMTPPQTAIGAALGRAGFNTVEYRLRMLATDALKKHHGHIERSLKTFEQSIDRDQDLIREALRAYLISPANNLTEAARTMRAAQNGEGGGHAAPDTQQAYAATPPADGTDQKSLDPLARHVRPVREPSAADRAAAARVAQKTSITILDTFRVRDGRAIGDIRFGELESLRSSNAMEAALIRQIQRHATADHDARVRDVIKVEDIQRMIQKAAEVADVC